ncbi:unnamed protein product [Ophioblennius macclurei]
MAFSLPVWLAVQEELLLQEESDLETSSCFDSLDDEALFDMFHLTRPCIAFIVDAVRVRMLRPVQSVDTMVMVALNYYAHGICSTVVLQRLGLSLAKYPMNIVSRVSDAIAAMSEQFITFPQCAEARSSVASKMEKSCGIPNVLGVLAPAHFKIRVSPYERQTFKSFLNTQGYTSVVSQMIFDSDGNIMSVEECCVGGTCEQEMWDTSEKGREMEGDQHGPFWVIGGKGYCQSKHVLTPLSNPTSDGEIRFNKAHGTIYEVIRTTLGTMKRRFKCLMQLGFTEEGSLNKKSNIIKSCCVLHNIAKKFSVAPPPTAGKIEPFNPVKQPLVPAEVHPEAQKARKELIDSNFSVVSSSQD